MKLLGFEIRRIPKATPEKALTYADGIEEGLRRYAARNDREIAWIAYSHNENQKHWEQQRQAFENTKAQYVLEQLKQMRQW